MIHSERRFSIDPLAIRWPTSHQALARLVEFPCKDAPQVLQSLDLRH